MRKHLPFQLPITVLLMATIGLSGCVSTGGPGNGMNDTNSAQNMSECNEGGAALVGALVGGLLANGNNRVRGAALGASVAALACVAWNYNAQQTKTAAQAQNDFKQANRGRLPDTAQVVKYNPHFDPSAKVAAGGAVTLASYIEVVGGKSDAAPPKLEEEMVIQRPDGKEIRGRKPVNDGQGAGGYQTSFTVKMPKGVPEGVYPVTSTLYMNGVAVAKRDQGLQIVQDLSAPPVKVAVNTR